MKTVRTVAIPHIFKTFQTLSYNKWVILWLTIGILLRLFLSIESGWRIDFDEAFNGLLAFDIQQGDYPLFTPPEVVGGAGSPYILAVLFSVLGVSTVTFRLLSLIWSGLYITSTGWLAKTAFNRPLAILTMAFTSLAPAYMQFVGMKLWSSYIETILLGNLLFLATYHLLNGETSKAIIRWLVAVGFIAGVMFWLTWLGFYYFVPVGLVILWKGCRWILRWGWVGVLSFLVGSAPFWIFNIPRGMPTFARLPSDAPMTADQIRRVLIDFVSTRFPILISGHPSWGYTAGEIAIMLAILYFLGLLLVIWQAKTKHTLRVILAIFVFTVPVLYAMSTNSRNALSEFNPWEIDATGRYILMFHTVLPIGFALLVQKLWQWKQSVAVTVAVGVLSLNVVGTLMMNPIRAFDSPYYDRLPYDLSPLVGFLDERNIGHAWVDGGIGHVLMFITEEQVLTEDYRSVFLAGGLLRQPDIVEQIQSADPTVFITPIYAGQQNPPLQQALDDTGITYEMVRVTPTIAVYIIEDVFDPQQVAGGLGYQY